MLILVGLVLVVIGIVYFVEPAKSLPSIFPGHEARLAARHTKHGILALVLGIGVWIGAWFSAAPSRPQA